MNIGSVSDRIKLMPFFLGVMMFCFYKRLFISYTLAIHTQVVQKNIYIYIYITQM